MVNLSDVKVKISKKQVIGKIGFGTPLIFAGCQGTAIPYALCKNLEAVKRLTGEESPIYEAAKLTFLQETPPEKVAICADTVKATDGLPKIFKQDWRQLIVASAGSENESSIGEISEYVESMNDKMYFCHVVDLTELKALGIHKPSRTVALVYAGDAVCPEAALVGATAAREVGSFTYKNMVLTGVSAEDWEDLDLDALHEAGGVAIVEKAGDVVTSEGMTVSGEYADIMDSLDYIIQNMEYKVQKVLNINSKIPYTGAGISILEGVVTTVLKDAYNNGIIADDDEGQPMYSVTFEGREAAAAEDRQVRKYVGGRFNFTIAGAIHNVEINGEMEV